MNRVFVDTFHLVARANTRDSRHRAATELDASLGLGVLRITTHEVFLEFLAAVSGVSYLRQTAAETVRLMLSDPAVKVIPLSEDLFHRGLRLYEARPDKSYSLVDCVSMEVMRDEGITEVLTNDHHFEQEGFTLLIR